MGSSARRRSTCSNVADMSGGEESPRLSVVMPVFNGGATIRCQLEALATAESPGVSWELIVSDNGSTDDTAAVSLEYSDRLPLKVVDAGRARGINAARNVGVVASSGEWILLCDCDDEVDSGWLVRMVEAFSSGAELVGGPIDYRRLNGPVVRAWRGADEATVMPAFGYLRFAHGANCGFTRTVYDTVGGFDERFQFGGEDVEFFWRAQLAGFDLVEVPGAVVQYRLRQSYRALWAQSLAYGGSEVGLFKVFRSAGMPRRPWPEFLKTVVWLVLRLPWLVDAGRRGAWVRVLGQQVGRIRASLRYRTPYL